MFTNKSLNQSVSCDIYVNGNYKNKLDKIILTITDLKEKNSIPIYYDSANVKKFNKVAIYLGTNDIRKVVNKECSNPFKYGEKVACSVASIDTVTENRFENYTTDKVSGYMTTLIDAVNKKYSNTDIYIVMDIFQKINMFIEYLILENN